MTILGIETSCDETSAAVIKAEKDRLILLTQTTATSLSLHAATGGIIPERAAREQLKYSIPVIKNALSEAFPFWKETEAPPIDAIAITYGPGLIGSLLVGVETAKAVSLLWKKPITPVNHLYGHIYANWLDDTVISNEMRDPQRISPHDVRRNDKIDFPALALVVSGGHTDLVLMKNHEDLKVIGGTRDDAAGEAFDKIGRLLGLSYPAGPVISKLAEKGNRSAYALPRPMLGSKDFDFSFSGLKTAVLNLVKTNKQISTVILSDSEGSQKDASTSSQHDKLLADLCASVQQAIVDVLVRKTIAAAKAHNVKSILLGGGVAANDLLREEMKQSAIRHKLLAEIFVPQKSLCTDNGAMIAAAAYFNKKEVPLEKITADPELYY